MQGKTILLPLLTAAFLLSGCGVGNSSVASTPASEPQQSAASSERVPSSEAKSSSIQEESSVESVLPSEESKEEDTFIDVDYNPSEDDVDDDFNVTLDGWMSDIVVGRPLATGCTYEIAYQFPNYSTVGSYGEVTDNGVLEVIPGNTAGRFKLKALRPGRSVLCIYDADQYLHYRGVVEVHKKLSLSEAIDYMVETVDHYESNYFRGSRITFFDEGSGQYAGKDENVPLAAAIPFEFEVDESGPDDGYNYWFIFTAWDSAASGGSLQCVTFSIDYTGYMLNLFTTSSFVDWFTPVIYE